MSLKYWIVAASTLAIGLVLAMVVTREIRRVLARLRELEAEGRGGPRSGDVAEARALARLLMDEIALYHGDELERARSEGRILERLADELERARAIYRQRAPIGSQLAGDPFGEAVVERLAGGDPARLGPAPPAPPLGPG